jgi:hypothetical protein
MSSDTKLFGKTAFLSTEVGRIEIWVTVLDVQLSALAVVGVKHATFFALFFDVIS